MIQGNSFVQARLKVVLYLAAPEYLLVLAEGGLSSPVVSVPESESESSEVSG